jgi:hypothetical protein
VKKFLIAIIFAGLISVALAEDPGSPKPPCSDIPLSQIPDLKAPPSLTLDVTPEVLGSDIWQGLSARFTVRASAEGYVKNASLQVENKMRWDNETQLLGYWTGSPSQTIYYGPIDSNKNGTHIFRFWATVCYKLNSQVQEQTLYKEFPVPTYLPWLITGALDIPWNQEAETTHLRKFLWKEAEMTNFIETSGSLRGGGYMFIEGLGTGLAEPLRSFLAEYLVGGFMNRGRYPPICYNGELGCYSVAPVHLKLYTAPDGVKGLFREGSASLGLFGGQMDSHSYKLDGEAIAGVLVVRGYRRDYILLSKKGDYGDEKVLVIELPKGEAEIFRKVLSLAILQTKATEIKP